MNGLINGGGADASGSRSPRAGYEALHARAVRTSARVGRGCTKSMKAEVGAGRKEDVVGCGSELQVKAAIFRSVLNAALRRSHCFEGITGPVFPLDGLDTSEQGGADEQGGKGLTQPSIRQVGG